MEGPEIQFAEAIIDNGSFGTRTVRFETGRIARQAGGAVSAYLDGETMLLSTTTAGKTPKDQFDFFPLTVDVEERMYALGKIPGSFFRREGRPSTEAILTCRLIDRPLRPSFVKGLRNEVQVVITVLSLNPDHQYDVLAINAASASTQISGLPFSGPIGGVRVSLIDGQWVAFPTFSDSERSTFDMVVAGRVVHNAAGESDVAIMMVEAESTEATWNLVKNEGKTAPTEEVVADGLPHFSWRGPHTWDTIAGTSGEYHRFRGAVAAHGILEERRLAYVAFTRARHDLLLTSHVWGTAGTPRLTSRFLLEVRGSGLAQASGPWVDLPPIDPKPQNPRTAEQVDVAWPTQDHVPRRQGLLEPARAIADAVASLSQAPDGSGVAAPRGPWDDEVTMLLAERAARGRGADVDVVLPAHLSTSALVALAEDSARFTLDLRRPMPTPPALSARRGTAFHAWVEEHYARAAFVDIDELPGSADDGAVDDDLAALRASFSASEWADRTPAEVETSVETVLDGIAVRGRIDAVFEEVGDDGQPSWVVVDWKTGAAPSGSRASARTLQLAAYRIAWARVRGVPVERVRGAFFHAATGETTWPDLPGVDGITAVLRAARPG